MYRLIRSILPTVALVFLAAMASAQAFIPTSRPHQNFVDASGNPCAGCSLFTYNAGTTTPTATFTDYTGGTQNQNPIILDAAGGAEIWLGVNGGNNYKFVLQENGATIWTDDQIPNQSGPYCPISGCTFTGAINGVSGTFTGNVTAASATLPILNGLDSQNYLTAARQPLAQGLFRLRASLPNSIIGPIHVVIFGDSQTICASPMSDCLTGPTVPTNRWAELVRIQLQNEYGSHGTGVTPLVNNVSFNTPNPQYYTSTGTLTQASTLGIGPSQTSSFATGYGVIQMATAATVTFTSSIPWDHLNTYCATNSGSGTLNYQIDGGSSNPVTACNSTSGSATAHLFTSGAVTLTTHTATLTCATGPCYVYAMEGTAGTVGVSVDNLAVATAAAEFFGSSSSQLAFSDLITNVQMVLADLGTNDVNQSFGYSSTSYANALTQIVTHERGLSTPSASVMLIMPPVSSVANSTNWMTYTAAMQGVVNAQATGFVNFQDRWGTTTSTQYYSQYFCADQVHPCDFGNIDEFAQVSAMVLDAWIPLPISTQANNFNASTFVDRPGNAIYFANCNQSILGYTATQGFCNAGGNFQAPGTNNYTLSIWGGTPNSNGLAGVIGLFDQTNNVFAWNTNSNDDLCMGVPTSAGNVANCTSALFHLFHSTGEITTKNNILDDGSGNATFAGNVGLALVTGSQAVTIGACTGTNGSGTFNCPGGNTAGTGATAACFTSGGNQCTLSSGLVTITTGTGAAAGDLIEVKTNGSATADSLNCTLTGAGTGTLALTSSGQVTVDQTSVTKGQFQIAAASTPTSSHQYLVFYHCEQ